MKKLLALVILLMPVQALAQTPTTPAVAAMVCANNTVVPAPKDGQFFYVQCDGNGKLITTSGGGTVTSVSVATANGVSATETNCTTNCVLTFTLGAITPSSVTVGGQLLGPFTIGSTTITGGTNTRVVYDNSGVAGEYPITGTGNVVLSSSPTLSGQVNFANASATSTTLNGTINSAVLSLVLTSATGFPTGAGTLIIDNELIPYTSISGTTVTLTSRGGYGTTAGSHTSGHTVAWVQFINSPSTTSCPSFMFLSDGTVFFGCPGQLAFTSFGGNGAGSIVSNANIYTTGNVQTVGLFVPGSASSLTCGSGCATVTGNPQKINAVPGTAQTSVTVNFGITWSAPPICSVASSTTASVFDITSISTTAITFGASIAVSGGNIYALCF